MTQGTIKSINSHISDALEQWSDIMLRADSDAWAYRLDYSDKDLLNALQIFIHVWGNRGIKDGHLTEENVTERMNSFRDTIREIFGIDTIELTDNALHNN